MSDPFRDRPFPRGALLGAAALLAFTLVAALVGRTTGAGITRPAPGTAVEARDLRFEDRADGAVIVLDARTGQVVEVLPAGTNGFARGVLRSLARERRLHSVGAEPPFRLMRRSDGRVALEDPTTGRRIDLEAFGPTNAQVFMRLVGEPGRAL